MLTCLGKPLIRVISIKVRKIITDVFILNDFNNNNRNKNKKRVINLNLLNYFLSFFVVALFESICNLIICFISQVV